MAQAGRFLEWDGCFNARDLGGVGQVVPGAAVRADRLDRLTGQGWTTVVAHGVRTVVDLRNDDEVEGDRAPRPDLLTTVRITPGRARTPGLLGRVVGDPRFRHPRVFPAFPGAIPRPRRRRGPCDRRRPARRGRLPLRAGPGPHRDHRPRPAPARRGEPAEIAVDHGLSESRVRAGYAARGRPYDDAEIETYVAGLGTTVHALARQTAERLDARAYLLDAGLDAGTLERLTGRLRGVGTVAG